MSKLNELKLDKSGFLMIDRPVDSREWDIIISQLFKEWKAQKQFLRNQEFFRNTAERLYTETAAKFPFIKMKNFYELKEQDQDLWMDEAFIELIK